MRRARRFRHRRLFSNAVVSVAGMPFFSVRMLVSSGEFLYGFRSGFRAFVDLQTWFKQCLLTLYIAFLQSLISNTPYKVLQVFHLQ